MNKSSYFITTAIDYPNSLPHLGTAYEKIGADVLARYHRLQGKDTCFQMGLDEHSLNVQKAAQERGQSPEDYCDEMARAFEHIWRSLEISYDDFVRTTEERHVAGVQKFVQVCHQRGDIYKGAYQGWYCSSCEAFLLEKDLDEDRNCPWHKRPPQWLEEPNYFFRLSKYQQPLLDYYEQHPQFVRPESRRNEVLSLIRGGLDDISISRAGATWGIPFPFDPQQVVYVWFDALLNYITARGYGHDPEAFARYWPADVHIIGKDITRFHCVIWPAMLMSAQISLPDQVFAHGFVYARGEKLSKSRGGSADLKELIDHYGADVIRYGLLRLVPFDRDGEFGLDLLESHYNADLANDLGNLLNRTLAMANRYLKGQVPDPAQLAADPALVEKVAATWVAWQAAFEQCAIHDALAAAWDLIGFCNRHIEQQAPWQMRKENPQALPGVLYGLLEALRHISWMVEPVLPQSAGRIREQLGIGETAELHLETLSNWGRSNPAQVLQAGTPIFPKELTQSAPS